MSKAKANKVLMELKRRSIDLLEDSFPEQRAFIEDKSKLKSALTTRRAGKSFAVGLMMFQACLAQANTKCAYLSLTRLSCEQIMLEPVFKKINRAFDLGATFTSSPLKVKFKNGSSIVMVGIDTTDDEQEKLLGQHFKLVCIDECASYSIDLKKTIATTIRPTLIDDDGQLVMTGTPGNILNYFCDITEGRVAGWSNHFWTTENNDTIPNADSEKTMAILFQEEIDAMKLDNPFIEQDPGFQQHYRGKWVVDQSEKVVKLYDRNSIPAMPQSDIPFECVLGLDIGEEDDNAFVLTCFRDHDPNLYVKESFAKNKMTMDEIIDKVREYQKMNDVIHIAIDSHNKQYVEELKRRSGIHFNAAEHPQKLRYIQIMNSDLNHGRIKIVAPDNIDLLKELNRVIMDYSDPLKPKIKDHQKDHMLDSFLYAWRASSNFLNHPIEKEAAKSEEEILDEYWDNECRKIDQRQSETSSESFAERDWK